MNRSCIKNKSWEDVLNKYNNFLCHVVMWKSTVLTMFSMIDIDFHFNIVWLIFTEHFGWLHCLQIPVAWVADMFATPVIDTCIISSWILVTLRKTQPATTDLTESIKTQTLRIIALKTWISSTVNEQPCLNIKPVLSSYFSIIRLLCCMFIFLFTHFLLIVF